MAQEIDSEYLTTLSKELSEIQEGWEELSQLQQEIKEQQEIALAERRREFQAMQRRKRKERRWSFLKYSGIPRLINWIRGHKTEPQ